MRARAAAGGGGRWGGRGVARVPSCARAWELLFAAAARAVGACTVPAITSALRHSVGVVFLYTSPSSTLSVPGRSSHTAFPIALAIGACHTSLLLPVARACWTVPSASVRSQWTPLCVAVGAIEPGPAAVTASGASCRRPVACRRALVPGEAFGVGPPCSTRSRRTYPFPSACGRPLLIGASVLCDGLLRLAWDVEAATTRAP